MERTTLSMTPELAGKLRELSRRTGISQSALARLAVQHMIEHPEIFLTSNVTNTHMDDGK